ncbi:MAG: C10 family peptidase [Muribaculaceae bacterium]|nr:C10 family peptidase [Muribaculaceae bacterium]
MRIKLHLLVVSLLALTACVSQETDFKIRNTIHEAQEKTDVKISPEEAVNNAEKYFAALEDGTRSNKRTAYNISVVGFGGTRGENGKVLTDTLYYLINYENENGFALMSADRRIPELLAISEEGNLDLNDTTFNKGLAAFIDLLPTSGNQYDDVILPSEDVVSVGKPMLSRYVRLWCQQSPYNKYCPINSATNSPYDTGNLPLVMAQIMSFFKHPASCENEIFNWDDMVDGDDRDGVAKLLSVLGSENLLDIEYENDSYADPMNMVRAFYYLNYWYLDTRYDINEPFPLTILNSSVSSKAHPIIMHGFERGDENADSHFWVADGIMTTQGNDINGNCFERQYIHCVWGWKGRGNGYFLYNFDNKIGGSIDKFGPGDPAVKVKVPNYTIEWYLKDIDVRTLGC